MRWRPDLTGLRRDVARKRRDAYRAETDDLVPQVLAGEVDRDEWLARRAAIKARFPMPEEN